MKKALLVAVVLLISLTAVVAESPDFVSFEFGGGVGYSFVADDIAPATSFGINFQLNEMFAAGINRYTFGANNINALTMTVSPVDKLGLRLYVGSPAATFVAFGLGVGYDLFSNKNGFFTSLGIYVDWLASNQGAGVGISIEDGGAFAIGLKTKIGL